MEERLRPIDEPEEPEERRKFWEQIMTDNPGLLLARSDDLQRDFRRLDEPGVRDTPEFWEWLIELREQMWCRLLDNCDDEIDLGDGEAYDDFELE